MCLAIPMKVIEIDNSVGRVSTGGVTYEVNFALLPDVQVDDYVLVHAGFAMQKLDEEEARKSLELFAEMFEKEEQFRMESREDGPDNRKQE